MMEMVAGEWFDACAQSAIPIRGSRIVKTPLGCIALFKTSDGEVFALDDRCPHQGGPLSQGIVHGHAVTCPLHNWVISLETGEAQGLDEGKTVKYPVRIVEGRIQMYLLKPNANTAE